MISAEESAMRKIRKFKPDRKSIRIRLVTAFIVTSVIPILLINIISYCTKLLRNGLRTLSYYVTLSLT